MVNFKNSWSCLILTLLWIQRYTVYPPHHTTATLYNYADDMLLIALTVSALEAVLRACEMELEFLDMRINVKKSSCIRIGHCYNITCASITTCHGQPLQWASEFCYLGLFILSSRSFKCSLVHAKRSFYAAVNGKLLNLALLLRKSSWSLLGPNVPQFC